MAANFVRPSYLVGQQTCQSAWSKPHIGPKILYAENTNRPQRNISYGIGPPRGLAQKLEISLTVAKKGRCNDVY